jgi:hypothetical protein
LLYKQKINAGKLAINNPGDSEIQLKFINSTCKLYEKLFTLSKQIGKASWFVWKELCCLIKAMDYSGNIFSKSDEAKECTALTKVMKIKNANKGAVVCMLCYTISQKCCV